MGRMRSRSGCLTCRSRHVKCDEKQPECGNCAKSHRVCRREGRQTLIIRPYRGSGSQTSSRRKPEVSVRDNSIYESAVAQDSPPRSNYVGSVQHYEDTSSSFIRSPGRVSRERLTFGPGLSPGSVASTGGTSGASAPERSPPFRRASESWTARDSPQPQNLTSRDALLVHHYAVHLGRWLDCTDARQQFSVKIPALSRQSPILLQAIISFAARHVGDTKTADSAHEQCIGMIIVRLGSENVANDDVLLCAIVILRVFEQLSAVLTGSDNERHLAGCNALLRACQGSTLDLSAPTLREAAFWIHLRQSLHTSCINQQPPNVDFSLELLPIPETTQDDSLYSGGTLGEETAWANKIIWICSLVLQFCFATHAGGGKRSSFHFHQDVGARLRDWEQLRESVADWETSRPPSFDPIWEGDGIDEKSGGNPFPTLLFIADWHVVAFGFHVLASMLLLAYKPRPRFALRKTNEATTAEADVEASLAYYA